MAHSHERRDQYVRPYGKIDGSAVCAARVPVMIFIPFGVYSNAMAPKSYCKPLNMRPVASKGSFASARTFAFVVSKAAKTSNLMLLPGLQLAEDPEPTLETLVQFGQLRL